MVLSISKRFSNGLKRYNISLDNLKECWRYCGGEKGRHLNYYNLCCVGEEQPEHEDRCICGHLIKENCYITDGNYILTIGNCCIKRFLPNSTRTCERCNKPHRNRKDNLCIGCRNSYFITENNYILKFD